MIKNQCKLTCVFMLAIVLSGCGGESGSTAELGSDLFFEDSGSVSLDSNELSNGIETTSSFATPVDPVSSEDMAVYVNNPLTKSNPNGDSYVGTTSGFIINPLMN